MVLKRAHIWRWLVILTVTAAVAATVWHVSWVTALRQVAVRGEADLGQSADRLIAQLQSYRELSVIVADHPEIRALSHPSFDALPALPAEQAQERGAALLQKLADKTGAHRIVAFDPAGMVLAASEPVRPELFWPVWRDAVARAGHGALGRVAGRDAQSGRRSFSFATPIFGLPKGAPTGTLVVVANLEAIEAEWRGDATAVWFSDEARRIMATNRSELVLGPPEPAQFADLTVIQRGGHEIWRIPNGGPYIPELALHVRQTLPVIGMQGDGLVDLAAAARLVLVQTVLAALACLSAGGAGIWILSRRAVMARQLAAEEAANQVLELRVAERTRELSATNAALRREVIERKEAEAQLKATQDRLVQAGKLSALGEMSAGISHELNQPLMAIRSFAENAELLLEQGRIDVVAGNLARITELGHRMGRIIRNLRAFARQENAPVRPIDPVPVIDAAIEIMGPRMRSMRVDLDWTPPEVPLRVMAGEVRLQQVVMNLMSNALDAMEACETASLALAVTAHGQKICIEVADTGPGIDEPDRIFDPFYTTKEVGVSEGMGLGLSISYGLVQSFGGVIEGRNRAEGGAVFTITLPRSAEEIAA